jgi:hypothetical protein
VKTITLQLYFDNNNIKNNFINIYNVYNSSINSYNKIIDKNNLLAIKLTLRMQDRNIIIRNFNLYYFF